ncbi:MAG: site-specific integrase, partial [Salana multivorans]|nr:site-specific integrase [Salana multivorans]
MTTDPLARLLDGLDPTTAELLERHLAPMRQRTGTNHAGYLTQWRTWLAGLDAAPALLEARERHVQAWVSAMLDSGAAATTVSAKMTSLRALYGRALREGLVAEDPTRWVRDPVRARRSTRLWLDDTQSVELLDAADAHADPALRAAIYLWLMVGCRPAEPLHCDVTHLGSYDGQT